MARIPGLSAFASIAARLLRPSSDAATPEAEGPRSLLPAVSERFEETLGTEPKRLIQKLPHNVRAASSGWNAGLPAPLNDANLVATGAIPLRGESPQEYARNGTAVRRLGWEQHPVVQACIRVIADIAGRVPLQVYEKEAAATGSFGDEIEIVGTKHPLQRLLDAPSTSLSAQRYRKFLFIHELIYGNNFTFLERPPHAPDVAVPPLPRSLRVIRPEDITTVWVNVKGYPIYYYWRDVLGYPHTSPVQDILHVRDLSAFSFVFGYPRGASALNDIIGDNEASQFVRQMVTNSGQAGVYLIANDETDPATATRIEAQMYEQMVARGGRGRTKVLGGIKDVKQVAFSLRDLEFPDLRMVNREDICAAFGVDPRMVGIATATKDGGLSGVQYLEARQRLVKHTIEPLMADIESEMNLWLAPEFGPNCYVRFDPDALAAMVEDKQATSTRVLAEVGANVRTIEEAREVIELPPEFDPNHMLAGSSMVTPVAIAISGDAAALAAGAIDGEPGKSPENPDDAGNQSGAANGEDEASLQAAAGKDINSPGRPMKTNDGEKDPDDKARRQPTELEAYDVLAIARGQRVLSRSVVLSETQKVMLWKHFDQRATREEAAYRRTALILFGEEKGVVTRIMENAVARAGEEPSEEQMNQALDQATNELARYYKPSGEARARWKDRFSPLIGSTYHKGAAQTLEAVGTLRAIRAKAKKPEHAPHAEPGKMPADFPADFNLANPKVQEAILARARRLANHVGKTTARAVTDALIIGRKNGMGISEIARLIDKTAFGTSAGSRSVMIARTETVGALNQGEFDAAAETGVIAGKEWLTEGDDLVREKHREAEREGVIPLDDRFKVNGMKYPGDPVGAADEVISCRCTTLMYDSIPE